MSAERARRERDDADIVGTFHTFGEHGPAYEVVELEEEGFARIRVVESGETLSYSVANVRTDPQA